MKSKKYDLDERLIDFAVANIKLVESLPKTRSAIHLGGQLLRSGTSPSLNYGEAKSGESKNDFIHKVSIVLKELRETQINLKLLSGSIKETQHLQMESCQNECGQLVAIFHKTVITAKSKK